MDINYILSIIKNKLFLPKQRYVLNNGYKEFADAGRNWAVYRENLSYKELKDLENADGWDVADKDYVDNKILEVIYRPSAPILTSTILYSQGILEKDKLSFFNPGLLIQSGWILKEIIIISDGPYESDMTLYIKSAEKSNTLSNIKANNRNIVSAVVNFQFDVVKSITFELKFKKTHSNICSLQIIITH